jgi:hypothetical protein
MEKKIEYTSYVYGSSPYSYTTELTVTEIDNINRNYTVRGIRYWDDTEMEVNIIEQSVHFEIDDKGIVIGSSGSNNSEESLPDEDEGVDELAHQIYLETIKK